MALLHFITGGQRSGKSRYAQEQAILLSSNPVYMATSKIWDHEFQLRVQKHKSDRDERWENIEELKYINNHNLNGKVVVIDCVTLWLTNFFVDNKYNVDLSLSQAKEELDRLLKQNFTLFLISNEIGMGVHAETEVGRKFTDLHGWMNQYIASQSQEVILMISGLPLIVKSITK